MAQRKTKVRKGNPAPRRRSRNAIPSSVFKPDRVNHPPHYGGEDNPYEAIKVIEAWDLDFCLGNAVKYISRAGRKDPDKLVEDLRKAVWYLERRIAREG